MHPSDCVERRKGTLQPRQDRDDDVRAVAAAALLPLAPLLVARRPPQLPVLQASLWDILLDSEELSPSTGGLACFQ